MSGLEQGSRQSYRKTGSTPVSLRSRWAMSWLSGRWSTKRTTPWDEIDAFVNGAANTDRGSILDTTPEMWDAIMDVNAKGAFFALQSVAQLAVEGGSSGLGRQHPVGRRTLRAAVSGALCGVEGGADEHHEELRTSACAAPDPRERHQCRLDGHARRRCDSAQVARRRRRLACNGPKPGCRSGCWSSPTMWQGSRVILLGSASGVITGSIIDFDQQVVGAYPDTNE